MSENKQDVRLHFENYKPMDILSLRKLQAEHPSGIISKLASRIADRIEQEKRGYMSSIKSWITDSLSEGLYQGAYGPNYLLAWAIRSVWGGFKSV